MSETSSALQARPDLAYSHVGLSMREPISSDLMYRLLVQGVQDHAIYMLDRDGKIMNWNAGAERAKQYKATEIVGCNYACFYSDDDQAAGVPQRNLELAARNGRLATEGWRFRKDKTAFWASVVIEAIHDEQGRFVGFAKVTRDMTERRNAELKSEHLASHDGLTSILNRRGFMQSLQAKLVGREIIPPSALFYIDLDRFKPVNDSLGHSVGDALLVQAAERLTAVKESILVGRLGGDEFAMLMPLSSEAETGEISNAILATMTTPFNINGFVVNISASVGIALMPRDGADLAELMRNADLALYKAKFDGRNCARFYNASMGQEALARRNLEYRLRQAVARREFHLLYQPIVDGRDGKPLGFEALIRWVDEANQEVSPSAFIPLAETIGMMPEIGEWTLRTACQAAVSWPDHLYVAVNLSATQLIHPTFASLVIRTLVDTGLPARRLMLEITETSILADVTTAKLLLTRLREIGVGIALDDFGTGFSSLSLVKDLPLTAIKIDRSFITGNENDHQTIAFIQSVMSLCNGYNLFATAEGVETEEQRDLLLSCSCISMQGWLFGVPTGQP